MPPPRTPQTPLTDAEESIVTRIQAGMSQAVTIRDAWTLYCSLLPDDTDPDEALQVQRNFYAGASAVLTLIPQLADTIEDLPAILRRLNAELDQYAASVCAGRQ